MPGFAKVFVDTNVLVYAHDRANVEKKKKALTWIDFLWANKNGHLSLQVLNEFYSVCTSKLKPPMNAHQAQANVTHFLAWRPEVQHPDTLKRAWTIQAEVGCSYWDSLVIASALESQSRYLLSEDLQHQQQIQTLEIINPFMLSPLQVFA